MRQIGSIPQETDAKRFAAYLVTQGVHAHAEHQDDGWAIWVRDENQVDRAREEISQFRVDPQAGRYRGVRREADAIVRSEDQRRDRFRKNLVEMRGRWGRTATMRRPLTIVLIILALVASLATGTLQSESAGVGDYPAQESLFFWNPRHFEDPNWQIASPRDRLIDVGRGQVWRLVTPIFIHMGVIHLVFNGWMLFQLGGRVESKMGTWRFALLVLFIAVASNLFQDVVPFRMLIPLFPVKHTMAGLSGGLSGVVYGVFGYLWMKTIFDPGYGLILPASTIIILVGWLLAGVLGVIDHFLQIPVGNWAHATGLLAGALVGGFAPLMSRLRKS